MSLRSFVTRPIKRAFALSGRDIVGRNRYGHNVFLDIKRLSQAWQYPIKVFFDVGANDGQTIRVAKEHFRDCRITAFEPHPKTFLTLKQSWGRAPDVDLVNVALGAEISKKTMFEYDASTLNSLVPNAPFAVRFNQKARQLQISCTTIDKFCSDHEINTIDILKIDTEGCDFDVIKGGASMLAKRAMKFIYFEFNDIHATDNSSGGALAPIDQFIRPHGYRFIATYNDYIVTEGQLFSVSNALYALPSG
jgi:FkbM family methyltransferase